MEEQKNNQSNENNNRNNEQNLIDINKVDYNLIQEKKDENENKNKEGININLNEIKDEEENEKINDVENINLDEIKHVKDEKNIKINNINLNKRKDEEDVVNKYEKFNINEKKEENIIINKQKDIVMEDKKEKDLMKINVDNHNFNEIKEENQIINKADNNNINDKKEENIKSFNKEDNTDKKKDIQKIIGVQEDFKLELIIKSLKEKDEIIKSLQNDMLKIKKENEVFSSLIKQLKDYHENEINQIKQNYDKQINELKEQILKKEEPKSIIKRHEFNYLKENIENLTDKVNNMERVYESKIGFMESRMDEILQKGEEIKKIEENIKAGNNKDNNNNIFINDNYIKDENGIINNNIIKKDINEVKKNVPLSAKYDMVIYKDLNGILNDIFSSKNLKNEKVNKKQLDKLKNSCKTLFNKKYSPIDFVSEYIVELRDKLTDQEKINLNLKKIEIFRILDKLNDEVVPNMKLKHEQKVNINDFDIKGFRKEYGFMEEDYPDNVLKNLYMKYKGNYNIMINMILGIEDKK